MRAGEVLQGCLADVLGTENSGQSVFLLWGLFFGWSIFARSQYRPSWVSELTGRVHLLGLVFCLDGRIRLWNAAYFIDSWLNSISAGPML